eukprot:scaffold49099_cov24-Phaeocystis_antarctica.AAC.1
MPLGCLCAGSTAALTRTLTLTLTPTLNPNQAPPPPSPAAGGTASVGTLTTDEQHAVHYVGGLRRGAFEGDGTPTLSQPQP